LKVLLERGYCFLHGPQGFRAIELVGEGGTIVEGGKEAVAGRGSDIADGE